MYSNEIENLLKYKNYLLTAKEYIKILETSPQINHVIYKNDEITIWTEEGKKFILRIRKDK